MKLFCCGVNFQHEIGETETRFYTSIEALKKDHECWKECGIVEVEINLIKWIDPQTF